MTWGLAFSHDEKNLIPILYWILWITGHSLLNLPNTNSACVPFAFEIFLQNPIFLSLLSIFEKFCDCEVFSKNDNSPKHPTHTEKVLLSRKTTCLRAGGPSDWRALSRTQPSQEAKVSACPSGWTKIAPKFSIPSTFSFVRSCQNWNWGKWNQSWILS